MPRNFDKIFTFGPTIYKILLVAASLFIIVKFYPVKQSFHYKYELGKPWIYPDLYAPYDFVVPLSPEETKRKLDSLKKSVPLILKHRKTDTQRIKNGIKKDILKSAIPDSMKNRAVKTLAELVDGIYSVGFAATDDTIEAGKVYLLKGNELTTLSRVPYNILTVKEISERKINRVFKQGREELYQILFSRLQPDYFPDKHYSELLLKEKLARFNPNKKIVYKGELIIKRGKKITKDIYETLESLKQTYFVDTQVVKIKLLGFLLIVLFLFSFLLLYLKEFEIQVFEDNSAVTLIFTNIVLVTVGFFVLVTYFPRYIYLLPVIVVPFILKNFFNWRIALAVSIVVVFIVSLGMNDPYEFLLLQFSAAWMAVISTEDMTKRTQMFLTAGKSVLVYIFMYIAYELATKGDWEQINTGYFLMFVINGFLAVALIHELILIYEKVFGKLSDITLLELLNTDNKLLKKLADKAPGTFHHSLQVANLAEAVANELQADALLVRVGALYHDLGKMKNPKYFTENQTGSFNPHDDLPPEKSAEIVIKHVIDGIEIARRNGLPEKVIDFIRTHHGTDVVQYFYEKAKKENPEADANKFRYPGPNPFSKETAIVMMADSVEAASKSIKNPTRDQLDDLVDKVIDRKLNLGLFNNADITLKEINTAKKVLKNKLRSIYHPRVVYPDAMFDKNK